MYWFRGLFLILSLIFLFSLNCEKGEKIVAKVGNENISLQTFKQTLVSQFKQNDFTKISLENRKKTLEELIDYRLKKQYALNLKLNQTPEFIQKFESKENKFLAEKFYEIEVVNHFVTDNLIRLFWEMSRKKIRAVAIAVGFNESKAVKADRSMGEAIDLAKNLAEKIRKGESPTVLSEKFSDDPDLKKKKGKIDLYHFGMFGFKVDERLNKASAGEVVGPVATEKGIYILAVQNLQAAPKGQDFEKQKIFIKSALFKKFFRKESEIRYNKLTQDYKERLHFKMIDSGLEKFLNILVNMPPDIKPGAALLKKNEQEIVLARLDDQNYTSGFFWNRFGDFFLRHFRAKNQLKSMKKYIEDYLMFRAWASMGRKMGLNEDPEITQKTDQIKDHLLLQELEEREIRGKVKFNENELKSYFDEVKHKYVDPKQVELWVIALRDEKLAQRIYSQVQKASGKFETLAKEYNDRQDLKQKKGYLGFQKITSPFGDLVKKAFKIGENKVFGPVKRGTFNYIVKTGRIKEVRQKELSEVRQLVENSLKQKKERELREKLMENLRKKFSVRINQSLLQKMS